MWIERQVAPDVQHTKQVTGKLTTSSCSSAAAGEKAARSTCEPTSSHSALRAPGRARQPPSRTRAKHIYLSISISGIEVGVVVSGSSLLSRYLTAAPLRKSTGCASSARSSVRDARDIESVCSAPPSIWRHISIADTLSYKREITLLSLGRQGTIVPSSSVRYVAP